MPLDPNLFRQALSQFPAGVTVVTTQAADGPPIGVTVTAFSSLSLEPPLVLISLAKSLYTHKIVSESGRFGVNILAENQRDWGLRFAGMLPEFTDRFAGIDTFTAETGVALLPNCAAWLDCSVAHQYDGGDHSIFCGAVQAAGTNNVQPLLYFNRDWYQLTEAGKLMS